MLVLKVLLLRASGILLPFYLVMQFVSALQEAQQQDQLRRFHVSLHGNNFPILFLENKLIYFLLFLLMELLSVKHNR